MAEVAHPKGVLLERAQKLGVGRPEFKTERAGPEHEPSFLSDVLIDGETIARFSHQLRCLLTSVGAAADFLLHNESERCVHDEMLGIICQQSGRIEGLLEDFLVIARDAAADQRGSAAEVNLYHVTREAVRELRSVNTAEVFADASPQLVQDEAGNVRQGRQPQNGGLGNWCGPNPSVRCDFGVARGAVGVLECGHISVSCVAAATSP